MCVCARVLAFGVSAQLLACLSLLALCPCLCLGGNAGDDERAGAFAADEAAAGRCARLVQIWRRCTRDGKHSAGEPDTHTHTQRNTHTHTAHTHTQTQTHTYTHGCAASGHLRSTSPRPPLLCGLQFCFGGDGEGAKTALLSSFFDRLEDCRKSISLFLDKKRESFPRFYFLSDMMLLRALGTRLEAGHNVLLPEALQVLLPAARAVEIIDAESAPHVFAQRASLSESELLREEDEFSHDGNSLMIVRIFSHHEEEFDLLKSVLTAVCFAFLSVAKGRKPFCFVCLCFCACVSLCVIVCFSVCGTFLPSIVTHILVIFWRFPPPTLPRHPHPSSPPDHSNSQPRSRFCGRDGVAVCVAGRDWAEPR